MRNSIILLCNDRAADKRAGITKRRKVLLNHIAHIFLRPGTVLHEVLEDVGYFIAPVYPAWRFLSPVRSIMINRCAERFQGLEEYGRNGSQA